MRRLRLSIAAAIAMLSLSACGSIALEPPSDTDPGHQPTGASASKAEKDLKDLNVDSGLSMAGYSRDNFQTWAARVVAAIPATWCSSATAKVSKRPGLQDHKLVRGSARTTARRTRRLWTWISTTSCRSATHGLPGAKSWTAASERRSRTIDPAATRRRRPVRQPGKGDQDPSTMEATDRDDWCTYATDWITVKSTTN